MSAIATVPGARELAFDARGNLYVGTDGSDVYVIADADGSARPPHIFVHIDDAPDAGVTVGGNTLYVGTQFGIYAVPIDGSRAGAPRLLARVRTSGQSRDHVTTSVAYAGTTLYVSVGSSCNACAPDLDNTRASIFELHPGDAHPQLRKIASGARNAIALAIGSDGRTLWAGIAGADDLPLGHPYEMFDPVTLHGLPVFYGWPACYDDRRPTSFSGNCATMTPARVVFSAYATPIGAVFYPIKTDGRYAFPQAYRGGAFVTLHGSWHGPPQGLHAYVAPLVAFVPMRGNDPVHSVDFARPDGQWSAFVTGFQQGSSAERSGRPTGIAVGPQGSLFFADDQAGAVFRIRNN